MKITFPLCKYHLERMARRHWYLKGNPKIIPTSAAEHVSSQGIKIIDAVDEFVAIKKPVVQFDLKAVQVGPLIRDTNHPEYKQDPCYIYNDSNVLLGGLKQAQVLTNSIMMDRQLPMQVRKVAKDVRVPSEIHEECEKQIQVSCIFDAEQQKLPIKKDPLRPAWVFPRDYGITANRKNELICRNILRLCEQLLKRDDLSLVENAQFSLPLNAHGKQIQIELTSEHLVTSSATLPPQPAAPLASDRLPDLSPLHCTVSLQPQNFYELVDFYPLERDSKWKYCHTAFVHHNPNVVSNLYDVPVNADQIAGRLLMKAFCIASCQARMIYGQNKMERPITVQVVQTDGKFFSMMVYQLNSLDVEGPKRNLFWLESPVALYSACTYEKARPIIEGYNPLVLRTILALLSSQS